MPDINADPSLVAACGLYCGACKRFLGGHCPGCRDNMKATWCSVRACCMKNNFGTCAACVSNADPMACDKFNNFISKIFSLIFNSNRAACIAQIKKCGIKGHAKIMAENRKHTIKKT